MQAMQKYENAHQSLINVARKYVGKYLSTIPTKTGNIPSVVKPRTGDTTPNYPYVQVDLITVNDTSGDLLDIYTNDDCLETYVNHKRLVFQYTVYGSNSTMKASAVSIANELHDWFMAEGVLREVEKKAEGTVETLTGVSSLPKRLSTEYLEVASFRVVMNIVVEKSYDEGYINTFNFDGLAVIENETNVIDTFTINVN